MASILKNTLAAVAGLGLAVSFASAPALAQTPPASTNNAGFSNSGDSNSNEVFSGSGLSLTDLMSNARRADGLSSDEFWNQSDRNIDSAAADFRRRQQEAIDGQSGSATEAPAQDTAL
ncbi:MAG: hypothetical protein F6K65_37900 [Moorea sp. SIO3C2]|nr:hypothetical protein [Moorena sp. SIO3C2]